MLGFPELRIILCAITCWTSWPAGSPTGLTLGFGISFSGILVFALHHRSVLVASAHGEVEGGADGEGEDESLALAGQCLAEIQTLGAAE